MSARSHVNGMNFSEDVQRHSVHTLVFRSLKRTHDMFLSCQGMLPPIDEEAERIKKLIKARDNYGLVFDKVELSKINMKKSQPSQPKFDKDPLKNNLPLAIIDNPEKSNTNIETSMVLSSPSTQNIAAANRLMNHIMPKPKWHPPWKLYRVISGHLGWVRCVTVEPGNEWFATGAGDRVIKVWDLATGKLKISLTGHVSTVRGLEVSPRHPYLFSCGEDKQVKCWDLEYNKVVRHYHGHLSAIYSLSLHPTIDVLLTAGRDSTARVWDMRTKANVHTLTGHTNTVASVICQEYEPQVLTGSHDCTIRLWDLMAGKTRVTLTNHKKSVRSLVLHPKLSMFTSASPDNIKQWTCPDGKFIQNLTGHNAIVNCMAVNSDGVLMSGANNGTMYAWDWRTGYNFQRIQAPVQPGSMDSEAGVFAMAFDHSGTRLITADGDKTVKLYKEDDTATEESHPINWKPDILRRRKY
ncbi:pleiotropic regulator 1 [Daktulosphaira vitifoliae]|uniref:pleiotropic regulator 1 n=1 Tax=Daktulosphaira vitifoliae TaxID=58002 RepID=UPI0021A99452|nr:pleiotropic regulator 1 [Daktulosphaira vitifoliae]